ncbi:MAG: hypothetical protein KAV87_65175 [Desulfobacteraceae bacterium]|nr:hypothetical protein [Desulfobacteraceae bacterium]
MLYFLWRLLGRCFWIKLNSHWREGTGDNYVYYYGEWEQRYDEVRNNCVYRLIKKGGVDV